MDSKKYVGQVVKKLKCSKKRKAEIKKELEADVAQELETGATMEQVIERMGAIAAAAEEFNQNFSEEEKKAFKRQKTGKIIGIIAVILVLVIALVYYIAPKSKEIADSKIFNTDSLTNATVEVAELVGEGAFDTLISDYCSEKIQAVLTADTMKQAADQVSTDWGAYQKLGNVYMAEITQSGTSYAVVQASVSYENTSATLTLSFDTEMKLIGIYMK